MQARKSTRRRCVTATGNLNPEDDRLLRVVLKRSQLESNSVQSDSSAKGLTSIESVPTIQPTLTEFNDPISLFESLTPLGLAYGAVKLVPPEGWEPPFSLDLKTLQFKVREQQVHRLASGNAFSFLKAIWTAEEFKRYGDRFKEQRSKIKEKSELEWEIDYWRLVETQATPLSVLYGADIEVSEVGSGFPSPTSSNGKDHHYYSKHPWNLLNLSKVEGSLLKSYPRVIPGVTCPWLYVGMLFSSFCWHTEDNYFAAVNYHHLGDSKIWYVIPPNMAPAMEKLMKEYLGHKKPEEVLHSLTIQLSPTLLANNGIRVNKVVQKKNEFVLLWPRTFHCGFNTGFNCNEACNVAPPIWLDWGHLAVSAYRNLRPMCIPYEQLIHVAVADRYERIDVLQGLIRALTRVVTEEYHQRRLCSLIQLPLIPSRHLYRFLPSFESNMRKSEKKVPVHGIRLSASDSDELRCCFQMACNKSVHLFDSPEDEILAQYDALSRLPCLDCDHCKAACHQGFVSCPHSEGVLCLPCINASRQPECKCTLQLYIYRFPLRSQLQLLRRLKGKLAEVTRITSRSNSLKNESSTMEGPLVVGDSTKAEGALCKVFNDLQERSETKEPDLYEAELLEMKKAVPVKIGQSGPFIWKSVATLGASPHEESSSSSATKSENSSASFREVNDLDADLSRMTNDAIAVPASSEESCQRIHDSIVEDEVAEASRPPSAKRARGRPRVRELEQTIHSAFVPVDLAPDITQSEFRAWMGISGAGRRPAKLQPPPTDFNISKGGINDTLHRVSSRHLLSALLDEDGSDSDSSDTSSTSENSNSGPEADIEEEKKSPKRRKVQDGDGGKTLDSTKTTGGDTSTTHELESSSTQSSQVSIIPNLPNARQITSLADANAETAARSTAAPNQTVRRKRGRPPKSQSSLTDIEPLSSINTIDEGCSRKRRRGRKRFFTSISRKQRRRLEDESSFDVTLKTEVSVESQTQSSGERRRGRPRKVSLTSCSDGAESDGDSTQLVKSRHQKHTEHSEQCEAMVQIAQGDCYGKNTKEATQCNSDSINNSKQRSLKQRYPLARRAKRRGFGWSSIRDRDTDDEECGPEENDVDNDDDEDCVAVKETLIPRSIQQRGRGRGRGRGGRRPLSVLRQYQPAEVQHNKHMLKSELSHPYHGAAYIQTQNMNMSGTSNFHSPTLASMRLPPRSLDPFSRLLLSVAQEAHTGRRPVAIPAVTPVAQPASLKRAAKVGRVGPDFPPTQLHGQINRPSPFSATTSFQFAPIRKNRRAGSLDSTTSTADSINNEKINTIQSEVIMSENNSDGSSTAALLMANGDLLLEKATSVLTEDKELKATMLGLLIGLSELKNESQLRTILGSKIVTLDQQIEQLEQVIVITKALLALRDQSQIGLDITTLDANPAFNRLLVSAVKTLVHRLVPHAEDQSTLKYNNTTLQSSPDNNQDNNTLVTSLSKLCHLNLLQKNETHPTREFRNNCHFQNNDFLIDQHFRFNESSVDAIDHNRKVVVYQSSSLNQDLPQDTRNSMNTIIKESFSQIKGDLKKESECFNNNNSILNQSSDIECQSGLFLTTLFNSLSEVASSVGQPIAADVSVLPHNFISPERR